MPSQHSGDYGPYRTRTQGNIAVIACPTKQHADELSRRAQYKGWQWVTHYFEGQGEVHILQHPGRYPDKRIQIVIDQAH